MIETDNIVVKFAGDSGDGMQLSGTLFSDTAALSGNDIFTYPDYPPEVRAPRHTVAGVSGFQVHIGSRVFSPGDRYDILVAMNPASMRANMPCTKLGSTIIIDIDSFTDEALMKAGYSNYPLTDELERDYTFIKAPITSFTERIGKARGADKKSYDKCRNMFALGIIFYITNKSMSRTVGYLEKKFAGNPEIVALNKAVLHEGYEYADKMELPQFHIVNNIQTPLAKGRYRSLTGNVATAWGLLAASERSGRGLFLGSYPITPATDIMSELAKHKSLGVKVFQAEDEIAGICSSIGAAYAGALACTSTSGPGFSLMSEALGLAVMTELPLVVVNVQRGGPSTGMPTKSEQSDLMQALYGRNGEAPLVVMAATSVVDCFYSAYMAAKLAIEHMTPVVLLTDGYLGNGSQLFRIPSVASLLPITPPLVDADTKDYKPFQRDEATMVRQWALPGTAGMSHRIGGLEKTPEGVLSTDPENHQLMVSNRQAKIDRIANVIPRQTVDGIADANLLVVGWGSTEGAIKLATDSLIAEGIAVARTQIKFISPLPHGVGEILRGYRRVLVCELNSGQLVAYLRSMFPDCPMYQFNKVKGQPFEVEELKNVILEHLNAVR